MERILDALGRQDDQPTGRLFRDLFDKQFDRAEFETLLTALSRARKLEVNEDAFEKDGELIRFRRAKLTAEGAASKDCTEVALIRQPQTTSRPKKRTGKRRSTPEAPLPDAPPELVEALTRWRLNEARQRAAPAFTILNNATLQRLAALRPESEEKLLEVKGVGPAIVRRHGAAILKIIGPRLDDRSPECVTHCYDGNDHPGACHRRLAGPRPSRSRGCCETPLAGSGVTHLSAAHSARTHRPSQVERISLSV